MGKKYIFNTFTDVLCPRSVCCRYIRDLPQYSLLGFRAGSNWHCDSFT